MRKQYTRLVNFCRNAIPSIGSTEGPRSSKRRRIPGESYSSIAAEVQQLESRKLLTVTYQGGALLTNVEAQGVYLGADWSSTSSLATQAGQTDKFLSTIVQSSYIDTLTQAGYGVNRGSDSAGVMVNANLSKTTPLTDGQIQSYVQGLVTNNQVQAPDANRLYIVYVEPGVVISANGGFSSPNFGSGNSNFLGYHGAFAGTTSAGKAVDIHYAVIAYPGGPNYTSSSQGFASDFDQLTSVTSHELGESVTDANVGYKTLGWYDLQKNVEIGDLTTNVRTTLAGNGVSYVVQELINKNDQAMPLVNSTTTLSAPQIVSLTATSTTTAQLTWNGSAGAQGYRVYEINGSQSVLITTLGSTATSVSLTGLSAGATYTFKVEAFNASAVADSQTASVTMPPAQLTHLTAPQVHGGATSATTAILGWNGVAGAQGYRIFYWNGSHAVYLGTVGSSTLSVQITGLPKGSTTYFYVEAFSGTQVADSAWFGVTTPKK